jgi:gamma-glutamyltranspeptidase
MLQTVCGRGGAVTSPHYLASEAGLQVLKEGGSAADAAVAIAATLAVVYPHMNGIGGDSFWLVSRPGAEVVGVDACGAAAAAADMALYRKAGHTSVPWRGPLAANTVAGTLSGWAEVLRLGPSRLPLARLLEPAIAFAERGAPVTRSFHDLALAKRAELQDAPGFAATYLPGGEVPRPGDSLRQPALGGTLRRLAAEGLDSAYRGPLARTLAADLEAAGSPVSLADLQGHRAAIVRPLSLRLGPGRLYNMPPPTQGMASLAILALFDRLPRPEAESFGHVHGLVEATKRAFRLRDRHVCNPDLPPGGAQAILDDVALLDRLAGGIDPLRAMPWPAPPSDGDTVWFAAMDAEGGAVSAIQSVFFEFGSGVVLGESGVTWQNRGSSFTLVEGGWNALQPGRKPFHTLNPAMAELNDGRRMAYGTMGGEGQPQTQAAVFTRYAVYGQDLQQAISAPRWLLGRTWGEESTSLKLEDRFDPDLVAQLQAAGHPIEMVEPLTSTMGHAGAIVRQPDGGLQGATDPRSDGAALVLEP